MESRLGTTDVAGSRSQLVGYSSGTANYGDTFLLSEIAVKRAPSCCCREVATMKSSLVRPAAVLLVFLVAARASGQPGELAGKDIYKQTLRGTVVVQREINGKAV